MRIADEERVNREVDEVARGGCGRCQATAGDDRCMRMAGHPGAHFVRGSGFNMRWGPGRKVGAFYPRKRCA